LLSSSFFVVFFGVFSFGVAFFTLPLDLGVVFLTAAFLLGLGLTSFSGTCTRPPLLSLIFCLAATAAARRLGALGSILLEGCGLSSTYGSEAAELV
jgi:hypothetical protein